MNMTRLPGVPNRSDVLPGMAFFQNTGPYGTTCGTCVHRGYWRSGKSKFNKRTNQFEEKRVRSMGCWMFLKLSMKHGPPVKKEWAACKFWEPTS